MTSTKPAGSDPAPRPKRRTFSPEYRLRIVDEHDAAPKNEKGAILRRDVRYGDGQYLSDIAPGTCAMVSSPIAS
jgi:hypothetical protein